MHFSKKIIVLVCLLLAAVMTFAQWSPSGDNIYYNNIGNVGIGTSSPDGKLVVHDNNSSHRATASFNNSSYPYNEINIGGVNTGSASFVIGMANEAGFWNPMVKLRDRAFIFTDGNINTGGFFLGPYSNKLHGLYINGASGNLGLGINNPWARMDVRTDGANAADQNALNLNNPSSDPYSTVSIVMGLNSEASSMISSQRNNLTKGSSLFFHTSDASGTNLPRMWINDVGYVGIGTNTPQSSLEVVSTGQRMAEFKSTATGNKWISISNATGQMNLGIGEINPHPYIWSSSNNFFIGSDANPSLFVNGMHGGNVGIGTTTPGSYKLAVEGTIGARKVRVQQTAWADFVFEKEYKLLTLQEVEMFIQKNKHLPNIPSAKEVVKNGIDLGENQSVLLQKIEELTLYVIDLKKENTSQQTQIKELESTNKLLIDSLQNQMNELKKMIQAK